MFWRVGENKRDAGPALTETLTECEDAAANCQKSLYQVLPEAALSSRFDRK